MAKKEAEKQINFVRIAGTDINSESSLLYGLTKIKGVSFMFSNALCHVLKFDKNKKIGELDEKELEIIEKTLTSSKIEGIPQWMLNSRKNLATGEDLHVTGKDIEFELLQTKRRLSRIKTYRGLRLRLGLTVRGQRTKSNFRRNKTIAAMKSKSTGGKR